MIRIICGKKIGRYGYRGAAMALLQAGIRMNHKKVARLMEKFDLQARIRKANPYKKMFKETEEHKTFENLLDRQFDQKVPEKVAGTDITYLPFQGRFIYFSAVKDFADGEILAWSASWHVDMSLVTNTLDMLETRLGEEKLRGFLLHSDQGCHYTSPQYYQRLARCGIIQSMSRRGNCIDNASTESFFGHLKDELDLSRCATFEEVEAIIADYIAYYNNERRQWGKKKMTPVAYRDHLLVLTTP
jgi:transposase InsO family protein